MCIRELNLVKDQSTFENLISIYYQHSSYEVTLIRHNNVERKNIFYFVHHDFFGLEKVFAPFFRITDNLTLVQMMTE
jgi:hypothetical protein